MESDPLSYMQEALRLAEAAARAGEAPIGAVIVRHGDIIARARNTRESTQDATGHAEIVAIREASRVLGSWRLIDCDLFVTLEPCLMCAGAIIQARIRRVYFGAHDPKSGMAGSVFDAFALPANHRVEVIGGLLEQPCGDLLRDFFARRRRNYDKLEHEV
ncbi:MAG: tRNA adenosine(34) deaminase TadA [Saccharofermentanales bacterium]